MNERLTLQDLIDILAKKQDITKKDAETFLRELFAVIAENIEKNDSVKIKDFGVFKLVKVNARKSVDVNTGEAIEIAAHYKLSFTPDKLLKDAVNRPLADFESVVLEDGVSFDDIETEDIKTEDAELVDIVDEPEIEEVIVESVVEAEPEIDTVVIIEEREVEERTEELVSEEQAVPEEEDNSELNEEPSFIEPNGIPSDDLIIEEEGEAEHIADENTEGQIEQNEEYADDDIVEDIPAEENLEDKVITPIVVSKTPPQETSSFAIFESHKRKSKRRRYISLGFIILLIIAAFAIGGIYFQEIMGYFTGQMPVDDKNKTVIVYTKQFPD